MNPINEILTANIGFYDAFESLDINRMEAVWHRADYIRCIHPGWSLLTGWQPVMESWKRIFENTEKMGFSLTNVAAHATESIGWVTLYENLTSTVLEQNSSVVVVATNIYEKHSGRWLMIHHHGSPIMGPPPELEPTVH